MSTKRRDNKGRVLLNGKIQKESGRYRYQYIDILGKRRESNQRSIWFSIL